MKNMLFFMLFICQAALQASGFSGIQQLQRKYYSFNDFSADFAQTANYNFNRKGSSISGKFYYKKENKFRMEFQGQLIVSDGTSLWNYNRKQNRVTINSSRKSENSFDIRKFIFDYPVRCNIAEVSSSRGRVIQLSPKRSGLNFKFARIILGPSGFIEAIEIKDLNNSVYSFRLSNLRFNQNLSDEKFRFYPPKGSRVIDLR